MSKEIKIVWNVLEKARDNGHAKNGAYEAVNNGNNMTLEHNGTRIFFYDFENMILGGYSNSDRDAIYTAMKFCGMPYDVSIDDKFKKKAVERNGNWYVIMERDR